MTVLDTVLKLQQALMELLSAQQRLAGVPEWMRELHDEHSRHKADIDALDAEAQQAELDRRSAEAAVEDNQEKLRHYQQQISQVSTQREYKALLKEIDTVKELIRVSEDEGLAALERQEEAQQGKAEREVEFRDLDSRYQTELAKWDEEKPAVEEEIRRLEGTVEALRNEVPRNVWSQLERLRERYGGEAVAPISKVERAGPNMWHCGICNYRVRPQVVMDIRNNGSLIHCDSCQRFLYYRNDAS